MMQRYWLVERYDVILVYVSHDPLVTVVIYWLTELPCQNHPHCFSPFSKFRIYLGLTITFASLNVSNTHKTTNGTILLSSIQDEEGFSKWRTPLQSATKKIASGCDFRKREPMWRSLRLEVSSMFKMKRIDSDLS